MNNHWLDRWHLNSSTNKDYDFIDGLRGVAILLVLACHLVYVHPHPGPTLKFISGIFGAGSIGVTLFFALSGFLISLPFWKAKIKGAPQLIPPGYGWRRFYKIYPPLLLSISILTPIYIWQTGDYSLVRVALQWLVGMPLIAPISTALNPVMWSLIMEVEFYILLPLFMVSLKKVSAKTCLWVIPLLFIAQGLFSRVTNIWYGEYNGFSEYMITLPFYLSNLDVFSLGIFVAGLHSFGLIEKAHSRLADAGFILLLAMLPIISWFRMSSAMTDFQSEATYDGVKIASGLLLCYVANPQCAMARLLCHPWLRFCGIISYEWYLFHQPIVFGMRYHLGPASGSILRYGAIVGGSFFIGMAVAAVVYRCFSLPILKYGRARNSANREVPVKSAESSA